MFPDLEFIKTILNAITFKFRSVQSNVDAIKLDVDAVNANVDGIVDGITDGLRTKSLEEAINFPTNLKVYAGTKVLEVNGKITNGSYGSTIIDTPPVFNCYLSKSATYSLLVKINDEEISSSITIVSSNNLKITIDGYGELDINAGSDNLGYESSIRIGSRLYVSLVYAEDDFGPTLLTDDDITYGGTNYNNIKDKLTTDKAVSLYLSNILPNLEYTFIEDIAIDNGSTSISIRPRSKIALNDTSRIKSRSLFKLGVLPNNFSIQFISAEISTIPLEDTDDMVLFTWGEIPGTFQIVSYKYYVSKAHTLIKNFDTFEANTTYLIWIRSSIVFAFKVETLTEDGLIIS